MKDDRPQSSLAGPAGVPGVPRARVAVNLPVQGTFSYRIPGSLEREARVGHRILVPFNRREVTGFILERLPPGPDEGLKEISEVLDPDPLFHEKTVPLFEWLSRYYVFPIGQVIASALPGGLDVTPFKTASLTGEGEQALKALPAGSKEKKRLLWIKAHPGRRLPAPVRDFRSLMEKKWITIEGRVGKARAGPCIRRFVRPRDTVTLQAALAERGSSSRARNEVEFLERIFASGPLPLSDLTGRFGNAAYLAEKWCRKGFLDIYAQAVYRNPAGEILFPSPRPDRLYEQQARSLARITAGLDGNRFSAYLLHGVTGSGKTEVYCGAVEHAIRQGRQAIVMVPEISLAVYMESIFRSRFGERVAVYHSALSRGERFDQWVRMARGEVDLVIGARSALFAPLERLGLIIVDEEHDSAYKQENDLHYQARDTAVMRARMEGGVVVLGSGTPSVQSFQNAVSGRYRLLSMPDRVEMRPLPEIEIVDMRTEGPPGDRSLSPRLVKALHRNLEAGNQAILFLNRRGYHRLHLCRSCGRTLFCPNCDVALTHHRKEDRLVCHFCGFMSKTDVKCPACGRDRLKAFGFGTEKVEQEVAERFPGARIARMDADNTRRKGQAVSILKQFSDRRVDILVGTQMITKGYDFPGVTLVGVIAADASLVFPDFRAGERTFQLLSQVAGRSGRGDRKGRVIVQTFQPGHYAIRAAVKHDYAAFFNEEKRLREQLGYPPFSHLACLKFQGNRRRETGETVRRFGRLLSGIVAGWPKQGKEIRLLGPVEAPISRLKGKYRWQILIKCRRAALLGHLLAEIRKHAKSGLQSRGVQVIWDVDPYQML